MCVKETCWPVSTCIISRGRASTGRAVVVAAIITMFESLEKAIQQREKVLQRKDLYFQSEEHKQFYSICKGIPFYRWEYLLNNLEATR